MNKHRRAISKQIKKLMRMDRSGRTSYKEAKQLHKRGFRVFSISDEWLEYRSRLFASSPK